MTPFENLTLFASNVFSTLKNNLHTPFIDSKEGRWMLQDWLDVDLMYLEARISTYLFNFIVLFTILLLLAVWYYKQRTPEDPEEILMKQVYEVHTITGSLSPSLESIKRCIMLLNEHPYLVNHAMPPYGFTPFLRACWSGNTTLVRFMLRHGNADIYSATLNRESALFLAAYRVTKLIDQIWDPSLLNLLYNAGCKVNSVTVDRRTVLHLAAKAGHVTLVRWLLDRGANSSSRFPSPYDLAVSIGDTQHQSIAALIHTFRPQMAMKSISRDLYNRKLSKF